MTMPKSYVPVRTNARKIAIAAGEKRYNTGKPCRNGHASDRRTDNGSCIECGRIQFRIRYAADPKRFIAYSQKTYRKNPDAARARSARYAKTPEGAERNRRHQQKRRSTPKGNLDHRMSARLLKKLGRAKCRKPWEDMVGYSVDDLRAHLERQFLPAMSWSNMGKWHIDHIIPLASFSYTTPDDPDFKAAWALTNLRPLWAKKNIQKHARRTHLV